MFKIISYVFFVNITLLFGDIQKRDVLFGRIPFFDGYVCKHLFCVFQVHNESIVYCTILCKSNNQCTGFFYNPSTEQCSGSSMEATYVDSADIVNHSLLGGEEGSIYYREKIYTNATTTPGTQTTMSLEISSTGVTTYSQSELRTNEILGMTAYTGTTALQKQSTVTKVDIEVSNIITDESTISNPTTRTLGSGFSLLSPVLSTTSTSVTTTSQTTAIVPFSHRFDSMLTSNTAIPKLSSPIMPDVSTPQYRIEGTGEKVEKSEYSVLYMTTFKNGYDKCQLKGARLVWIENEYENVVIVNILNQKDVRIAYIGHTYVADNRSLFYYPSKVKVEFIQPWLIETWAEDRNCTALIAENRQWTSQKCFKEMAAICEKTAQ